MEDWEATLDSFHDRYIRGVHRVVTALVYDWRLVGLTECEDLLPSEYSRTPDGLKQLISDRKNIFALDSDYNNIAHALLSEYQEDQSALFECIEYFISLPEGPQLFKMKNRNKETPLHVWFSNRNSLPEPRQLEKLFKITGQDVNARDSLGSPMFLLAAERADSLACLKSLKKIGADHKMRDRDGSTALHFSASRGVLESVQYLMSIGVSMEQQDSIGNTPLLVAAFWKHVDIMKYFISEGANVLAVNKGGNNIAHMILMTDCDDIPLLKTDVACIMSLQQGRELFKIKNKEGKTPLESWRDSDNLHSDIQHIADIIENFQGATRATDVEPESVATTVQENDEHMSVLYTEQSPEIDWFKDYISERGNVLQVNKFGNNIAHQLLIRKQEDQNSLPHLIMYLVSLPERREIFSTKNKQNKTPLRVWIESENLLPDPETIKKILQVSGENLEEVDGEGCTMFLAAAKKPDALDCLKCLKDLGADHTVTCQSGGNALHLAALYGILHSVKYFVSIGLLPNDKDNNGDTPLHLAACWQNIEVMKYLIEVGANVLAADNDGDNVAHMLLQRKNDDPTAIKRGMHYLTTLRQARDLFNTRNNAIKTPLQLWMAPSRVDHPLPDRETIIKILQTSREDINAQDVYGYTMFLNAVSQSDCVECLRCLKDLGANKDALNSSKRNILHISAMEGKLEAVKYAVSIGFDLEQMDIYGYTPLLLAAMEQQVDVLQYLMGQQANILAVARNGDNIAHLLSFRGNIDRPHVEQVFNYLLSHPQGRRLFQMENKKGITPCIRPHSWD